MMLCFKLALLPCPLPRPSVPHPLLDSAQGSLPCPEVHALPSPCSSPSCLGHGWLHPQEQFVTHSFCAPHPLGAGVAGLGWVLSGTFKRDQQREPAGDLFIRSGQRSRKAARCELPGAGGGIDPKNWPWLWNDHLAGAVVLARKPQPRPPTAQRGVAKRADTPPSLHSRPLNSCRCLPWAKPPA